MKNYLLGTFVLFSLSFGIAYRLRTLPPTVLPVYESLKTFSLRNQEGRRYTEKDLLGRVTIVNFIFTSCHGPCPLISQRMAKIQKFLDTRGSKVKLLSISVDPERDTPGKLKAYAKRFGANFDRWTFVTGPLEPVKQAVIKSYLKTLPSPEQNLNREDEPDLMEITHGENFALFDTQGRIREFHQANTDEQISELLNDAALLVIESQPEQGKRPEKKLAQASP